MTTTTMGSGVTTVSAVLSDLQQKFSTSKEYISTVFESNQTRIEERLGLSEKFALDMMHLIPITITAPSDSNSMELELAGILGEKFSKI